jgi:hypothetical protein
MKRSNFWNKLKAKQLSRHKKMDLMKKIIEIQIQVKKRPESDGRTGDLIKIFDT